MQHVHLVCLVLIYFNMRTTLLLNDVEGPCHVSAYLNLQNIIGGTVNLEDLFMRGVVLRA